MQAMVLERIAPIESSPLALRDWPEPQPAAGEVRLRVSCCAICRTDLHVIEGDLPEPTLPLIPGHQIVGVVEEEGPGCTRGLAGRRVGVAWLRGTCGHCEFCAGGRENLCEASRFTGYHHHGGFAGAAVVPEDWAYELPEGFADEAVAPLLCAGLIGYRALQRAEVPPGGSLGIFGFGSSAHLVIQIALHRGCRVFVVSRGGSHRESAKAMGAHWVGSDPARIPERLDGAIVFAPVGEAVPPALEALKKGGTLALAGITMTATPPLDYERHLFHERTLRSVTANTREDGRELLALAAEIPLRPRTTLYPLAEANRALLEMKQGSINGTGVLTVGG